MNFRPSINWIGAAIIFVAIAFSSWFFYEYASHVEFPREMEIAKITNATTLVEFTVPKGRHFWLLIGTLTSSSNQPSGVITISSKEVSTNYVYHFEQSDGWRIPFRQQAAYSIEIKLDQPPPPSLQIGLKWVQAYKDRDKSNRICCVHYLDQPDHR
jgi:hypothetical protein